MIFSNDDQKNKYHQVWKEIFKIVRSTVNDENRELKIHEKIRLFGSDMLMDKIIRKFLKVKFTVNPVRDDKYLVAKLKIFNRINRTTFNNNNNNNNSNNNNNNNNISIERNHYICIPAIDIDSLLKIDNKRAYPQAYLEQCKYKLKKRKIVNYIDDEIIDENSDSDIDDAVDSHLNFSAPDSYIEI